jgi:hypothetical protein
MLTQGNCEKSREKLGRILFPLRSSGLRAQFQNKVSGNLFSLRLNTGEGNGFLYATQK